MYCPNCGNQNDDGSRFCFACGLNLIDNSFITEPTVVATLQPDNNQKQSNTDNLTYYSTNNVIDLTGQTQIHSPEKKKDKGIIATAFLTFIGWIAFLIISYLIGYHYSYNYWSSSGSIVALPVMLSSTISVGLIGTVIVLVIKSKYKSASSKINTKIFVLYCILSAFVPALICSLSYAKCFEGNLGDLIQVISFFCVLPLSIIHLAHTLKLASYGNTNDMIKVLLAYFFGFGLSGLLGLVFIKVFALFAIGMVLCIIAVIAFLSSGGFIIIERNK